MPNNLTDVTDNNVGKMTDNEIKKALECCSSGDDGCDKGCPLHPNCVSPVKTTEVLMKLALELINRLQAENERLTHITRNLIGEIKAEAYTEFAEEIFELFPADKSVTYISRVTIKNILNEKVGEDNA